MSASLSTHVLDLGNGVPVAGAPVELYRAEDLVASDSTNEDGRIPELAQGLEAGRYTLVFVPPSPFFRRVELDVALEDGHYHVPLLVA
ncbi:MAG: hydroxyisourate hydrolase, partial [Actinomycetota bacterium]|nr:hydroxyisourate hydrolase [Actinomycetota bacterium]